MWPFNSKAKPREQTQDEQWVAHYNDLDAQKPPMSSELNARLLKAIGDNCMLTAKQSLEKGASPELCWQGRFSSDNDNGRPLLHYAVRHNNEYLAWALLQHGADVKRETPRWTCLLSYAVDNGNSRMVRLLLDNGVDPAASGKEQHWQEAPYEVAKKNCYTDIMRMLEQEPALRAQKAAAALEQKKETERAAARAKAEEERVINAAEVTKRITVSKPLTLKGVKPVTADAKKTGWRGIFN